MFHNFAGVFEVHLRGRVIGTTAEHPFFVVGKGHLPANNLDGLLRQIAVTCHGN